MLEFCKDNEIEVLMVVTPVWHTFRENADSLQLALMRHEATSLSERHNFPLLDLYDSSLFTEDDFFDSDHLSVNGARRLSSIVSKF